MNRPGYARTVSLLLAMIVIAMVISAFAQTFHNAPASATEMKNPVASNSLAVAGGKKVYAQNCAQCHGNNLQGMGPAPTLLSTSVKSAAPGQLFWFITNGDLSKGMPSWPQLSQQQRWQVVSYLRSQNGEK